MITLLACLPGAPELQVDLLEYESLVHRVREGGGMGGRAFTLIELLVVLAIVAVLVAILLPVLAGARRAAQAVQCQAHMRQIALASITYAQQHRGLLPRSTHSSLAFGQQPWGYALTPQLGYPAYAGPPDPPWWPKLFRTFYRCPGDARPAHRWSYGKNVYPELQASETGDPNTGAPGPTWGRLDDSPRPGATIWLGELRSGSMGDHIMAHFWWQGGLPEVDGQRHGQTANYAYLDGHAAPARFADTFDLDRQIDDWNPATAR